MPRVAHVAIGHFRTDHAVLVEQLAPIEHDILKRALRQAGVRLGPSPAPVQRLIPRRSRCRWPMRPLRVLRSPVSWLPIPQSAHHRMKCRPISTSGLWNGAAPPPPAVYFCAARAAATAFAKSSVAEDLVTIWLPMMKVGVEVTRSARARLKFPMIASAISGASMSLRKRSTSSSASFAGRRSSARSTARENPTALDGKAHTCPVARKRGTPWRRRATRAARSELDHDELDLLVVLDELLEGAAARQPCKTGKCNRKIR